ncbi:hypothetical protein MIR68_007283 [Amoeboaphelidium protococcarum]|nr:hypothetical protein MIR68_007283 [Amoeboaphelidium protococcarum]
MVIQTQIVWDEKAVQSQTEQWLNTNPRGVVLFTHAPMHLINASGEREIVGSHSDLTCLIVENLLKWYKVKCLHVKDAQSPQSPSQTLPFMVTRSDTKHIEYHCGLLQIVNWLKDFYMSSGNKKLPSENDRAKASGYCQLIEDGIVTSVLFTLHCEPENCKSAALMAVSLKESFAVRLMLSSRYQRQMIDYLQVKCDDVSDGLELQLQMRQALRLLNDTLMKQPYLCGDQASDADIYLFSVVEYVLAWSKCLDQSPSMIKLKDAFLVCDGILRLYEGLKQIMKSA